MEDPAPPITGPNSSQSSTPKPQTQSPDELIANYAQIGASDKEIADLLGMSEEKLSVDHKSLLARLRAQLRIRLRARQVQLALDGDKTTLLWLAKTLLQQSDRPVSDSSDSADDRTDPATLKDDTDDQVLDRS